MKPNYKTIAEALEQLRFCEYKDKHHGHPLEMNAAFQYLETQDVVIEQLQQDKAELVEALKRILWLMDEKQLVESEPSHCGPLLLDEARMILAKHGGEPK